VIARLVLLLTSENAATNSLLASVGLHFAFGGGLFYGVQKFFEAVEKTLSADTKLEISVWLLDLRPSQPIRSWPSTFAKIFDSVFGHKIISWKFLRRSFFVTALATTLAVLGCYITFLSFPKNGMPQIGMGLDPMFVLLIWIGSILASVFPDYLSLLKTRWLLMWSVKYNIFIVHLCSLVLDILFSALFALGSFMIFFLFDLIFVWWAYDTFHFIPRQSFVSSDKIVIDVITYSLFLALIPALFGRLWLILYNGSGLLLIAFRRIDIGFAWFNRVFDCENKPLQCIGFVAGALSTFGYWLLSVIHLIP
jgi:hypothetical protein